MSVTIEFFLDYAIDNYYECFVYDFSKEENIFEGTVGDIPFEILQLELISWEIDDKGRIGFNVNKMEE